MSNHLQAVISQLSDRTISIIAQNNQKGWTNERLLNASKSIVADFFEKNDAFVEDDSKRQEFHKLIRNHLSHSGCHHINPQIGLVKLVNETAKKRLMETDTVSATSTSFSRPRSPHQNREQRPRYNQGPSRNHARSAPGHSFEISALRFEGLLKSHAEEIRNLLKKKPEKERNIFLNVAFRMSRTKGIIPFLKNSQTEKWNETVSEAPEHKNLSDARICQIVLGNMLKHHIEHSVTS